MNFTVTSGETVINFSVSATAPAGSVGTPSWADITGKPTTFPPSTHNHDDRYPTDAEVATLLADKAPLVHTQTASTITDITEAVQDIVAGMLAAGTNVTLSYNDTTGSLSITTVGGAGGGLDAEAVRDAIGIALVGVGNISVTVNDAADTITISTTATANSTDAQLRDRSTHTGTQAISTVTNLQAALDAKLENSENIPEELLPGIDFPVYADNTANPFVITDATVNGEAVKRVGISAAWLSARFIEYLQSLTGYSNTNTLSLRANLTWETSGSSQTPTETDAFSETFPNTTGSTNVDPSTLGWSAAVNAAATAVVFNSGDPVSSPFAVSSATGRGGDTPVNAGHTTVTNGGFLVEGNSSRDRAFYYRTRTISRSGKTITGAALYMGCVDAAWNARMAIKIGSQWYVTEVTRTQTAAVTSAANFNGVADGSGGAELKSWTLNENANTWRLLNFTPGSALSLGALHNAALPAGNITDIGVYFERTGAITSNIRFDTAKIKYT